MKPLRVALLALFAAEFAIADLALRRPSFRAWFFSAVLSAGIWFLAASVTRSRPLRAVVSLASATLLVVQVIFFRYYHVFLDDDGLRAARNMWSDVKPVLVRMLPSLAVAILAVAAIDFALLSISNVRVGKWHRIGAAIAIVVAFVLSPHLRDASPDVSALWATHVLARAPEARAAADVQVPVVRTRRDALPNVLFILDESVRATDYDAEDTPETTALTRGRIDLREMRSVASYTSIAVSSLLTSRPPNEHEATLQHTPYVFDFVRSIHRIAKYERVSVGYFSSQTDSLFERRDVRAATDAFVTVDELVGHRVEDLDDVIELGVDRMLAARVERDLPKLQSPFFAMVHLSGTHAPYFVDDARAPYKPYRHTPAWSGLTELHAAYRDAIFEQDASVARVLRAFFQMTGSQPWMIVFTSDHGEAFGEHAAIHHGQSLYDEQIHVPGWVMTGNGAIAAEEARTLTAHENEFVTHLDLTPTIIDAYGALDAFGTTRFTGSSLLRAHAALETIPLTNCTDMFPCPVHTWGMLSGSRALVAQPWDAVWHCVDLHTESEPTNDPACAVMITASRAFFPTLPNGKPN